MKLKSVITVTKNKTHGINGCIVYIAAPFDAADKWASGSRGCHSCGALRQHCVWQTLLKGCKSPQEKKLATHFGKSYVRGAKKGKQYEKAHFKLQIWNLHHAALNGEPTTNNSAEAWHRHIQVMLKDTNMSFCSFIEKLRHSLASHENKVEQIRLGRETPTRNPKTIKKYEKIRSFLKVYDEKTPLEILDMLAYNLKVD